jgi:dTDP-4-amino-4,6-dideoxygalactose transaminase
MRPLLQPINKDLTMAAPPDGRQLDVALLVGFFGFLPDMDFTARLSAAGIPIIFDLTHSLLSSAALAAACSHAKQHGSLVVASLRKLLPLPDGGIVWSPYGSDLRMDNPTLCAAYHANTRITAMRSKRFELEQNQQRSADNVYRHQTQFLAAEEALDKQTDIYAISTVAHRLIKQLDIQNIVRQRRANYAALLRQLNLGQMTETPCYMPLFPNLPDGVCPLGFPLLATNMRNRDTLCRQLLQHNIISQILWPLTRESAFSCPAARHLSMRMLVLPCDHRYSEDQMAAIGSVIKGQSSA